MPCPLTGTTAVFDIILLPPSFDQQTIRQHYLSTVHWLEKSFVSACQTGRDHRSCPLRLLMGFSSSSSHSLPTPFPSPCVRKTHPRRIRRRRSTTKSYAKLSSNSTASSRRTSRNSKLNATAMLAVEIQRLDPRSSYINNSVRGQLTHAGIFGRLLDLRHRRRQRPREVSIPRRLKRLKSIVCTSIAHRWRRPSPHARIQRHV